MTAFLKLSCCWGTWSREDLPGVFNKTLLGVLKEVLVIAKEDPKSALPSTPSFKGVLRTEAFLAGVQLLATRAEEEEDLGVTSTRLGAE